LFAETKLKLQEALLTAQQVDTDYVIEIASSIDSNAIFHRLVAAFFFGRGVILQIAQFAETTSSNYHAFLSSTLRTYASRAASHALMSLSQLSAVESAQDGFCLCKIAKLEYSLYG